MGKTLLNRLFGAGRIPKTMLPILQQEGIVLLDEGILYWQVMPHLHGDGPVLHVLDFLTFLGIGGIFLASLGALMRSRALVPVRDPRLAESLHFEST